MTVGRLTIRRSDVQHLQAGSHRLLSDLGLFRPRHVHLMANTLVFAIPRVRGLMRRALKVADVAGHHIRALRDSTSSIDGK